MTALPYYDKAAGEWVAFRDEPARRYNPETRQYETVPGTRRAYLYNAASGTTAYDGKTTDRFHTKADAMAAARKRWPDRVKGCRIGAERITG